MYLVGDPQQLPATVISPRATAHGYNVSLFRRLQANGFPVQVQTQKCLVLVRMDTVLDRLHADHVRVHYSKCKPSCQMGCNRC